MVHTVLEWMPTGRGGLTLGSAVTSRGRLRADIGPYNVGTAESRDNRGSNIGSIGVSGCGVGSG